MSDEYFWKKVKAGLIDSNLDNYPTLKHDPDIEHRMPGRNSLVYTNNHGGPTNLEMYEGELSE